MLFALIPLRASLLHVLRGNVHTCRYQNNTEDCEKYDQRDVHRIELDVGKLTAVGSTARLPGASSGGERRSRRGCGGRRDASAVSGRVLRSGGELRVGRGPGQRGGSGGNGSRLSRAAGERSRSGGRSNSDSLRLRGTRGRLTSSL